MYGVDCGGEATDIDPYGNVEDDAVPPDGGGGGAADKCWRSA